MAVQFAGVDGCRLLQALFVAAVSAIMQRLPARRPRLIPALATGIFVVMISPLVEKACRQTWRWRLPGRAVAPLTARRIARRPPPTLPPALPTLRDLRRVIPIAQAQTLPSGLLMLLSLESYGDGAVIHGRLLGNEQQRNVWLEFVWDVVDDTGRHYRVGPTTMGGNGQTWRFSLQLWQPLDEAAKVLRLELQAIEWYTWRRGKERELAKVERGPWLFGVDLQAGASV